MFDPQDEIEIKKRLSELTHDVRVILFTQTLNCETCPDTERLLKAVAALSERVKLELLNPLIDREKAAQYNVTRVPAIIIEGDRDYGIRYFGLPAGYEFASFLEALVTVGKRESGLSESSKALIASITDPMNLKVFVTPGWPHCPAAVVLSHRMAMESDQITAEAIEATEFPDLAQQYRVMAVPRTVVNENTVIEGAMPESMFVKRVVDSVLPKENPPS